MMIQKQHLNHFDEKKEAVAVGLSGSFDKPHIFL